MKQITLWILVLFGCLQLNAQVFPLDDCGNNLGTTLYGPMYSVPTANAKSRMAVIYPASQLTTLASQTVNTLYFDRFTTSGAMLGSPTYKIYMKEVPDLDWGSGALDWATATTGAVLVYDGDPTSNVGTAAGWRAFPLSTSFVYSGTQHLALFFEYSNPSASIEIEWVYNYTNPCIVTTNSNTTKYSNSTAAELPTSLTSSNYRRPVLGFDFVTTCAPPTGLTLSNLDSDSVDLTWTPGGTATQWEYAVGPAGAGLPPTSTLVGSNSLTNIPLDPGTSYEIFVRSYCAQGDTSIWVSTGSFTTNCTVYDAFTESFDLYATGATSPMPNCWAKLGTGSTYVQTGGVFPGTPPNRLYMTVSATTFTHAIMPAVTNLSANTHRLRFKAYATTTGKTMQVGYQTDLLDPLTFVSLQTISLPGTAASTAEEFIVEPTGVPIGVNNLIFRNGGGVATNLYIDDVVWESIPSCLDVSGLSYSSIDDSQVTFNWTAGGAETAWQYVYGDESVTDPGTLTPINVTTNPTATITPLLASTTYKIWVRSNCGSGNFGIWIGPLFVSTLCPPVTTFFENFDSYATGSANPLADCWGKAGNGSIYINTGSLVPNSPPNRLYLFANGAATVPTTAYALMPPVSNLQSNTHRLKFKAYATTVDKTVDVGYIVSASNLDSFVTITTINLPGTTSGVAEEFIVEPTAVPAGINRLVFRNIGATSTAIYIDDVAWELIPSCQDVTNLILANISDTQATFNWSPAATETAWQYVYGDAAVTDPSTLTPVDINGTPTATLGPLAPFTSYQIWVRSNCGSGSFGAWIGPLPFRTQCGPVAVFSENFENSVTGAANPMTDCWDRAGNGSTYITTGSVAPSSPPNRLYMSANGTATIPTQAFALMPPVSNLQADTHRLKFTAYCSTANKQLEIGYFGSITDISTFTMIEAVVLPSTTAATAQEFTIMPSGIPPGVTRLVFRNGAATGTATLYIDNVIWEAIPPCDDITDMFTGNATSTAVNIAWNPGGSETAWQYVYGPTTVTDPTTLIPFDVLNNPMATVSSLQPATTYNLWVRSSCTDGFGNWSDPITISTTCAPVTEYSENFDSYATGSTNPLPVCWTEFGSTGSVYITTGSIVPATPSNRMYFSASGSTGTKAIAVLPPVSNLQAETHRLKFKAYCSAANSFIEVGYFENTGDANTFVTIAVVDMLTTTAATAMEYIVTPTFITAGVESLVLRNTGTATGTATIYIDDVIWEAIPSCTDIFGLLVTNVTNGSAGFQWEPGNGVTAWQYAYGLETVEDPSTLTPVDVTNNPIGTASGLMPNTTYKFWVRSNCGSGSYGNWSTPFTFTTDCNTVTEFSENFDSYATGLANPLPDCWKRAGNANTYVTTGGALPGSAPNRLYMTGNGATPTASIAIMPAVSNLQAETHRLKFKVNASTLNKYLEIGYLGDTADVSTFILLETLNVPGTNAAAAQEFIIEPVGIPAGITSLVFRNPGTPPSGITTLYIDDVVWEPIPITLPACAQNISVTVDPSCGNFATQISWDSAAGTADGYFLSVGTSPGGFDVLNSEDLGNVTTYALGGNFASTYYFTLVPYNSFGAATGCVEQSFTTVATGCYCPSVPTTNSNSGITNVMLGTNNFPTTDVTYFDHSNLAVNLEQGVDANLQVTFGTAITYNANVWIDMNDNFTFETDEIFFQGESATTNPNTMNASFLMPANAPLGIHRMRIGSANTGQLVPNPCYGGSQGVTLDFNVNVIEEDLANGDFNRFQFKVFPNPVKDVLTVSHNENISEVTVFNLLGQQVLGMTANAAQVQLDMAGLASGTYLVKVTAANHVRMIKVIKE